MAQTTNDKIYAAVNSVKDDAVKNYDKIYTKIDQLEAKIESNYITREEFMPIKNFVYGLITMIVIAVGTAVITMVIKK